MRSWLKYRRDAKNLTMREVAVASGISEGYYSLIESGKRNVPVETAKAIAIVLEFDWQEFYDEGEET